MNIFNKDIEQAYIELFNIDNLPVSAILALKRARALIIGDGKKMTYRKRQIIENLNSLKKPTEVDKNLIIKKEFLKIIYEQ